MKKVSFEEV